MTDIPNINATITIKIINQTKQLFRSGFGTLGRKSSRGIYFSLVYVIFLIFLLFPSSYTPVPQRQKMPAS